MQGRIDKTRSYQFQCLPEDGKFIHTRCFTRDITERKRTEGRLALQYAVTQILAESEDLIDSGKRMLRPAANVSPGGWRLLGR